MRPRGDRKLVTFFPGTVSYLSGQGPNIEDLHLTIDRSLGDIHEVDIYQNLGGLERLRTLYLTLHCRNMELLTDISDENADNYEYSPICADIEMWFRDFEDGLYAPLISAGLNAERVPCNGHIIKSLLNGAIDGNLAIAIFDTINGNKGRKGTPLHSLKLEPVGTCRFFNDIPSSACRSLQDVIHHVQLSWHVQRGIRDDDSRPTAGLLYPGAQEYYRSIDMGPMDEDTADILEHIWPGILDEGNDWRTDWYSRPLSIRILRWKGFRGVEQAEIYSAWRKAVDSGTRAGSSTPAYVRKTLSFNDSSAVTSTPLATVQHVFAEPLGIQQQNKVRSLQLIHCTDRLWTPPQEGEFHLARVATSLPFSQPLHLITAMPSPALGGSSLTSNRRPSTALDDLPPELLQLIAEQLDYGSVLSLGLVNRTCRRAAVPDIFRGLLLRLDKRETLKQEETDLTQVLSRSAAFKHVRFLEIDGRFYTKHGDYYLGGRNHQRPWIIGNRVDARAEKWNAEPQMSHIESASFAYRTTGRGGLWPTLFGTSLG